MLAERGPARLDVELTVQVAGALDGADVVLRARRPLQVPVKLERFYPTARTVYETLARERVSDEVDLRHLELVTLELDGRRCFRDPVTLADLARFNSSGLGGGVSLPVARRTVEVAVAVRRGCVLPRPRAEAATGVRLEVDVRALGRALR